MSRNGISYQDVANAAIKVQGNNENPTVDRVREILGTGSKSTIARHLKDWRANNGPVASANDLPPELIALVTGLWERLQGMAEQEILEYSQEADQKINDIENSLALSQEHNASLQLQIHLTEEVLGQEKAINVALSEDLANERIEASKNQERTRNLEDKLSEHKQENVKLHTLLTNVQNNLEHYQESVQKLQQEQSIILANQKSHFEQELSIVRNQLLASVNEANTLQLQLEKLQQTVVALEHVKNSNLILQQTINDNDVQMSVLQEKYKEIVRQNEKNDQNLELKSTLLIESEQKHAITISRLRDVELALSDALGQIAMLRHEQLFTIQEKAYLEGRLQQLETAS